MLNKGFEFAYHQEQAGISSNPGAVNVFSGTGKLGRMLGFGKDSGVRLGGVWIGNADILMSGGTKPGGVTFNSLFIADLQLDLDILQGVPGAAMGASFLQFDGQNSNGAAGVLTGYNALTQAPPLNRSELYELWWRQTLMDKHLILRVGKSLPTVDFNNVIQALQVENETPYIPQITGLLFSPIFANASILGVIPGYYNSAWGLTVTAIPDPSYYISYGIYDGSLANGRQTGTYAFPSFNSYYFTIGEAGYSWAGESPGKIAVGGWGQSGTLVHGNIQESGAQGFYAFANHRLRTLNLGNRSGAVIGYLQYGFNNSKTMMANQFVGAGLTGFNLIENRPKDSIGVGIAVSWLNNPPESQSNEIITQVYYQAHLIGDIFFQPTFSYVPNPGVKTPANGAYPSATSMIFQLTALF
ncbi:porin [Candidatus Methylospira mobilis]|uniref:Porin n=1 Tax=Candidatus Methylospira mobilis TaxID=1808979 RepID=A0A5Q0BGQ5_9GAMM|nr:carbohydrate porin [Candidatus Methylospira mobilis]QFY43045.1 porin [Candidatus Methylospira mobilis]WNV03813.1 carbohydrate porin [Candidatus Methylospira mobilis]